MAKQATIAVEEGRTLQAIVSFLKALLEKGVVDSLLVPKVLPSGDGIVQTLIRDPKYLDGTNPISPTMPVQSARIISNLTMKNLNRKVGAVLKSCEIRAIIELSKFQQVKLGNLYLIGIDCPGTFEVYDYSMMIANGVGGDGLTKTLLEGMEGGNPAPPAGYSFRTACQMCEYPVPKGDIVIQLFGYPTEREVGIEVGERLERQMEDKGVVSYSEKVSVNRSRVIERVTADRLSKRDSIFAEFRKTVKDLSSFLDRFATCIRCHNCMVACPICYCKECVFRTAIFEHEGDQFLRWADRKGGIRMPTDTLLFHLIRMAHMATSCIGCGLCDSSCPSRLPVASLFRSLGETVQKMFEYVPGRDAEETPPVATFREDEFKAI